MSEREESEAKELYTGAEDFDKFDRKVQRWARRRCKGLQSKVWLGWSPEITEPQEAQ